MNRLNAAVLAVAALSAGNSAMAAQSGGQNTSTPATHGTQQATLTGCLRQTSDDARTFALVASPDADKATGTSGKVAQAPLYRPERYLDQTVTVTGEVERVFDANVFSLDEDRVVSTGIDVLVVSRPAGIAKDERRVTVTGPVRKFVRAELQKEIVDFDLRPEWLVDFESRPVIIATNVAIAK